jgi:hypothetical protein
MKNKRPHIVALFAGMLLISSLIQAQSYSEYDTPLDLYVGCDDSYTSHSGSASKTTDRYENGSATVTTSGPIKYSLTPNDPSIGTEETKNWTGKIWPDVSVDHTPGTTVEAEISGDWTIEYSRPKGVSDSDARGTESVTSTYSCNGECTHHYEAGDTIGTHEIVKRTGTETIDIKVHYVNVTIAGPDSVCKNDSVKLVATGYPSGGTYSWSTSATTSSIEFVASVTQTYTVTYKVGGVECKTSHTVTVADPGEMTTVASYTAEIPKKIMDGIESYKNLIPGGSKLKLTKGEYSLTGKEGDCCEGGSMIDNGKKEVEGSISVGIKGEDIPVGPWSVSVGVSGSVAGNSFSIDVDIGAFIDWDVSLTGTGGVRLDECEPDSCLYGSVGLGASATLKVTCAVEACIDTWFTSESCSDIDITPGSITVSASGEINYNKTKCSDGFGWEASIGKVTFSTNIPLPGPDYTWDYTITEGYVIHP